VCINCSFNFIFAILFQILLGNVVVCWWLLRHGMGGGGRGLGLAGQKNGGERSNGGRDEEW